LCKVSAVAELLEALNAYKNGEGVCFICFDEKNILIFYSKNAYKYSKIADLYA